MAEFRMEHDFLGDKEVPIDAYYGVQTLLQKLLMMLLLVNLTTGF